MRDSLTTDRTYYVSVNGGNNSNDGCNPITPWKSITYAYDFLRDNLDFCGKQVRVMVADGSYPAVYMIGPMTGMKDDKDLIFSGNCGSPGNVIISGVNEDGLTVRSGARVKLEGFMCVAVGSSSFMQGGHGLIIYQASRVAIGVMAWYQCDFTHIHVSEDSHLHAEGRQDLFGVAPRFVLAEDYGKVWLNGQTITAASPTNFNTPNGNCGFIHASRHSMVDLSGTILNSGYTFNGALYRAQEGSTVVLLGIHPSGLGSGYNDGTCIIIP